MILLTGANGLTGKYILPILVKKYSDKKIRAIVRTKEKGESLYPFINDYVIGDLSNSNTIRKALSDEISLIIHIAGIRYSLDIFKEAKKYANSIEQIVFIHTTGMYSRYREYSGLYKEIEEKLISCMNEEKIVYTILRPTMIYGSLKDKNMNKLIAYLSTNKIFPLFGQNGKIQPVHYKDLGEAIVESLNNQKAFNKTYNLSGGSVHTYGEVVQMIRKHLKSNILIIPIPYRFALIAGWFYEKALKSPKISFEQIRRLSEDKVFDHIEAEKDIGFYPISFVDGIKAEIEEFLILNKETLK